MKKNTKNDEKSENELKTIKLLQRRKTEIKQSFSDHSIIKQSYNDESKFVSPCKNQTLTNIGNSGPTIIENYFGFQGINNMNILKKGFEKQPSSILCGDSSFYLLYKIFKKDKTFTFPVPTTLILNSWFRSPVLIKNSNKLEFEYIDGGTTQIKEKFYEILEKNKMKMQMPVGLIKYPNGRKRLLFNPEEVYENFPDLSQNMTLQSFISPKGLRATKFRVLWGKNSSKIFIVTNNLRLDFKEDLTKNNKKQNDKPDIKTSVINHAKIIKYIKNFNLDHLPDLNQMPQEKKNIYEIFREDPTKPKIIVPKVENLELSKSDRYLTHIDLSKCQFYEGKNSGYNEIIRLTEYLREKINNFALKSEIIDEFAVDFLQDNSGQWIFLKIVYGATKKISKVRFSSEYMKNKCFSTKFNDNFNYKADLTIIKNLLNPKSTPESFLQKSFSYYKKLYEFY